MDQKRTTTGPIDAGQTDGLLDSDHSRAAAGLSQQLEDGSWQGFDARLAAALHDVPVPAGLADRLLACLQAADDADPDESAPMATAPATRGRLTLHRRATAGFAVAAGLLIAATAVWVLDSRDTQSLEPPHLAEIWYATLTEQTPQWQGLPAPRGFQIPDAIVAPAQRWEPVNKIAGYKGVVYDLSGPRMAAKLFVVRMPAAALPSRPPVRPQSTTGGLAIGVWQNGGLRYALVVEGDERAYRHLINSALPPLASLPFSKPLGFADRASAL